MTLAGMVEAMLHAMPLPLNASKANARRHAGLDRELDATILRLGSVAARDVLCYQLSHGEADYPEVCELVLGGGIDAALDPAGPAWSVAGLLRLARIVALQDLQPTDRPLALGVLRAVLARFGSNALGTSTRRLLAELAIQLREWQLAEKALSWLPEGLPHRAFIQADLLNPHVRSAGDADDWLATVNTALAGGTARLRLDRSLQLRSGDRTPFGALAGAGEYPSCDGPLVTIGVSCWRPDASLLTSVNSLLAQTWRNIEILIVDDCSPAGYEHLLEEVAALDPRVRVLVQPVNGGTYRIRNRVLQEARGEFFTVQDADDWAHPLRIQKQVESMLGNPTWMACHCLGFRCNDDLLFNYLGVPPVRVNESSLLFRRKAVVARVGYYHGSRKGADSEYSSRIRRAFGVDAIGTVEDCLTGIRLSTGSLSRAEFKPGWRHPDRAVYKRNYERWHAQAEFMGQHTGVLRLERPAFEAPHGFLPERQDGSRSFDVVFVGDFRARHAEAIDRIFPAMEAACAAGRAAALCHVESMRSVGTHAYEEYDVRVLELMIGGMKEISLSDPVQAQDVVFLGAQELQYLDPPHPVKLAAARAVVMVAGDELGGDIHGPLFDLGLCLDRIHSLTGAMAQCYPCDSAARSALQALLPAEWLMAKLPGMQAVQSVVPRGVSGQLDTSWGIHVPVEALMYNYPWLLQPSGRRVRICVPAFTGQYKYLPDNVAVYSLHEGESDWFLDSIDALVELEEWSGQDALSEVARQAQARGLRIFLPESWKDFAGVGYEYFNLDAGPGVRDCAN